jgi:hypothetical protein
MKKNSISNLRKHIFGFSKQIVFIKCPVLHKFFLLTLFTDLKRKKKKDNFISWEIFISLNMQMGRWCGSSDRVLASKHEALSSKPSTAKKTQHTKYTELTKYHKIQ